MNRDFKRSWLLLRNCFVCEQGFGGVEESFEVEYSLVLSPVWPARLALLADSQVSPHTHVAVIVCYHPFLLYGDVHRVRFPGSPWAARFKMRRSGEYRVDRTNG